MENKDIKKWMIQKLKDANVKDWDNDFIFVYNGWVWNFHASIEDAVIAYITDKMRLDYETVEAYIHFYDIDFVKSEILKEYYTVEGWEEFNEFLNE